MRTLLLALLVCTFSCESGVDRTPRPNVPVRYFDAKTTSTRFVMAEHMRASIEMQISGEPFAELLDRDLAGYDRFARLTDQYIRPDDGEVVTDTLGYAMAVESYEYSKQPMNQVSFEAGCGLSMQFAPLINPTNVSGDPAYDLLIQRIHHLGDLAHATGGPMVSFVISPPPQDNPLNPIGWPGFWPQFAEFRSFDPAITEIGGATQGCTFEGGYAAAAAGKQTVGNYECAYNGLNLKARETQVERVLAPDALGYSAWKQILWVINYWATLHDLQANFVTEVAEADLPEVGKPGNVVVGKYADPMDPTGMKMLDGVPGTYIGDTTIEGFQGLVMLDEMDNKAQLLLRSLTTTDGQQLSGFATIKDAIDYDWESPATWWPGAVAVTEVATAPTPEGVLRYFPRPTTLQIMEGKSRVRDLSALIGGFATFYTITDKTNVEIGQLASSRASYDGDPFPADNGMPDGENSPHDRALAVVKVALVNLDRLHFDATHKVLVDEATPGSRGTRVDTVEAAYAIVALRTAYRALTATLSLYGNDTPDTLGIKTILDDTRLRGAPASLGKRIDALIRAEADFIADKLTAADGAVANGYDLAANAREPSPTKIESQAGAIRGLLEAYLATSDQRYKNRAVEIYDDLQKRFWMNEVRAYRTVIGESDRLVWTPNAFGVLEGAMRQYWKLEARKPRSEQVAHDLLERLKRTFKLVVNGWDDANADEVVAWPDECSGAGLQMGERALTGELSRAVDKGDRDKDCVKDIGAVKLPASLAAEIVLERRK
jgi:hypothetical protein